MEDALTLELRVLGLHTGAGRVLEFLRTSQALRAGILRACSGMVVAGTGKPQGILLLGRLLISSSCSLLLCAECACQACLHTSHM